jgi:hypothetical protein
VRQPALELGAQVGQASEVLAVEGGPVELLDAVPWKRSQTALWLGERGGIRWCRRPRSAIAAVNWCPVNSGPLSVSTPVSSAPMPASRSPTWSTKAAASRADLSPATSLPIAERVAVSTAVSCQTGPMPSGLANVEGVQGDQIARAGREVAEPERAVVRMLGEDAGGRRGELGQRRHPLTAADVCRWMARTWWSRWPWRRPGPPDERLEAANPGKSYLTRHPGKA